MKSDTHCGLLNAWSEEMRLQQLGKGRINDSLSWRLFNSIHLNTPSSHRCAWNLDFDISWIPYICVQRQNQYSKLAHGWDAINVLFCFCAISPHFLFQKLQNSPNKQFQQKIPLPFQPNAPKEGKVAKTSETLFRIMKLQRGHHSRVNFNILTMYFNSNDISDCIHLD